MPDRVGAPPAWRRRTKTPEKRETAAAPTSLHTPQLDNQGPTRKARCFANHPINNSLQGVNLGTAQNPTESYRILQSFFKIEFLSGDYRN